MSGKLIVLTGVIYLYVAAEQVYLRGWGGAIMYFGYAFANVGAYLMLEKK